MKSSLPRPDALIFDLDGTLVDTEPLYSIASQRVLDAYDAVYTAELKQRCMGGAARLSAQIVIDEYDLPLTAEEYLELRERHLVELFRESPEIAGAGAFVEAAHAAGLRLGLATSSMARLKDIKLADKSWAALFDASICGDHPELKRSKPEPDIFLLCASTLAVPPAQCIVFEDSRNGVAAAVAAGMTVIGINSVHIAPGDLAEAALSVNDFHEALALLDQWQAP